MNNTFLNGLLIFSLLLGLLWLGKAILLPVVFGFLLWLIVRSWRRVFERVHVFGWHLPTRLQTFLAAAVFIVGMWILIDVFAGNLLQFSEVYPEIANRLQTYATYLEDKSGLDFAHFWEENIPALDVAAIARTTATGLSNVFSMVFTVIVYLLFMFGEQKWFDKKLKAAAGARYEEQRSLLEDILVSIQQYISIKTMVSLVTAVLSYVVMRALGLEFAFVWAVIIFVMNYIPSIGSLIATAFPVLFAVVSTGTWWQPITTLVLIGLIQLYVGNVLEPKYMGKKLNISSLLVIFALFFWGALWGIAGMFLAVPLTVITMIILSRIPSTRAIGIFMSGDGEV